MPVVVISITLGDYLVTKAVPRHEQNIKNTLS